MLCAKMLKHLSHSQAPFSSPYEADLISVISLIFNTPFYFWYLHSNSHITSLQAIYTAEKGQEIAGGENSLHLLTISHYFKVF